MSEPWQLSTCELAETLRTSANSSHEALQAHSARLDAIDWRLNATIRRLNDEAFTGANSAGAAEAADDKSGLLSQFALLIRGSFDVAETSTTRADIAVGEVAAPANMVTA
jgi:Asp-tRNA(Asn)/Glu-tRNA(Gln) amidotransferase A subunit family amidase